MERGAAITGGSTVGRPPLRRIIARSATGERRPQSQPDGDRIPHRRWRIALYSHDTMGLGHMRRNLLIAQTLASSHLQPAILMLAGAREARAFAMPRGVDCLTLPALRKELDGRYESRSLDLSLDVVMALRSKTIRAARKAATGATGPGGAVP